MEKAVFAGGCFWCLEAVFQRLTGVIQVRSGYSGGARLNPTYEQVSAGVTGHAEAVEVIYDPKKVNYRTLLEIFFVIHNPTELNKQGNDVGTQYRSVIFYDSESQKKEAEEYIREIDRSKKFTSPVVTELIKFTVFYEAEKYHNNYYEKNKNTPYCMYIIDPKIKKLMQNFPKLVK